MSITLNATLKSALDGLDHHPICKIVSTSLSSDIPFDGNFFNPNSTVEADTYLYAHTSGRMILTLRRANDLYYMHSDISRTLWNEQLIYDGDGTGHPVVDSALVELSNDDIGIVFGTYESGTYYLYRMIVSPTGSVVTAATLIASFAAASAAYLDSPALCPISGGFLLISARFDGTDYTLRKRTCDSNFANWSGESAITLTGLISTRWKGKPTLLAAASGRIYCFFEYVDDVADENERKNIFYIYSEDNGSTWSTPEQLTNYDDFTAVAVHPSIAEKDNGDIILGYTEKLSVMTITADSTGWCGDNDSHISLVRYDAASGKLFVVYSWQGYGLKRLSRVLAIDVPTWTIEKCYVYDNSPGWNAVWYEMAVCDTRKMDSQGQYVAICTTFDDVPAILVINHQTQSVVEYFFADYPGYSIEKNIDYTPTGTWGRQQGLLPQIDADSNRLYLCIVGQFGIGTHYVDIGYIDLSETADPITGKYTFTKMLGFSASEAALILGDNIFKIWLNEGLMSLAASGDPESVFHSHGKVWVWSLSTGSLIKSYSELINSGFPMSGFSYHAIKDNRIYGSVKYHTELYDQGDRRGFVIIDMLTDTIVYEVPTFATADEYDLSDMRLIDSDRILMGSIYGVVVYDILSKTWTLYDSSVVPGLLDSGFTSKAVFLDYDESNNTIFVGPSIQDGNLYNFVESGAIYAGKYVSGQVSGSEYNFGTPAALNQYFGAYDATIAFDANDALWITWTQIHNSGAEESAMWDYAAGTPDLSNYILAGSPVRAEWEIGKCAKLSFSLARGDLFDPTNSMSILSPLLRKGRMIDLFFGENIGGSDYYQEQGSFLVVSGRMSYSRVEHPVIEIECEDRSTMWSEIMVTATEGYQNETLANVLSDILETVGSLTAPEYDIPTLANDHPIYMQWVEDDLAGIIQDICDHFGIFPYWGVDGVLVFKEIALDAAVSHDYTTAASKIIRLSPDDRYSSFINRIIVRCESREFLEVLWDDERIGTYSGTVGFWSREEEIKAWYSNDRTRVVRYPRLDIIQSIKDFSPFISMLGGGGDEYISSEGADETYCIIKIEAPNRALYAFAFGATVAAFGAASLYCSYQFTCGFFIMATNLALSAFIQVVTAVASYRYDLWGRPLGIEKQTYQATADDTEFQNLLGGMVVRQEFEDPLSYSVQHCQMVADQEIAVIRAQRNRISFEKPVHLQDEIGDIIRIAHPVTEGPMNIFIAKLQRNFVRPPLASSSSGKFNDLIEGWKL